MGLGDLVNGGLDKLEDGWDAGKKLVGEGIDKGTDLIGAGLEKVGADDWADKVEDFGDELASDLGATPGEQQLGQSDQANELIHGNPGTIRASASHLKDFRKGFDKVGEGMRGLDSSHWKGAAADTFREKFAMHPTKWLHAADACDKAARALEDFADTVKWAQSQAQDAIDLYKKGKKASDDAVTSYNKRVDAYNAKVKANEDPGPRPEPFKDPGTADIKRAHEILAEARRQRNDAGRTAATSVQAALAHAPAEPPALDRLRANAEDGYVAVNTEILHVAGGVVKGGAGLINFARGLNPLDGYNITHPAQYLQNVSMTLSGLVSTAAHPERAAKSMWEGFKKDPSEGIGRLIPELIGTKGLGLARGGLRTAVKEGMEEAAEQGARKSAKDAAQHSRAGEAVESKGTDPIDLATGRMYLPQTDVTLPGALPLQLTRRVESGYHLGRWFGPSWSSTLDQRLEIDAEGVVLVTEDGLLLAYPHPAPGLPTLPSHGPRWPLDREDGGYTVTDPHTHRIWHFADRGDDLAVLEQIDDRNGNWITFEYDAEGTPLAVTSSGGYHVRVTTESGRVTALHLAATGEELKRYAYTDGNLTEVINSSGLPLRFTYDESGRVTSWTDTNEHTYTYEYDGQDRCTAQGGTDGHMSLRLAYGERDPETGLRTTTAVNGVGAARQYHVNDLHQIVAIVDPAGHTRRFTRDRYNRLLSETDAIGRTTACRYDPQGNLTEVIRPDGRRTTLSYDDRGLLTRMGRPDGGSLRQEFDAVGNRTSVTDSAGGRQTFTYDEHGHLRGVRDQYGRLTEIRCDAAGLPVEVRDHAGNTMRYGRDAFGRVTTITDPFGATGEVEWSVEGHVTRRRNPDGTEESWTYDGEGNCLTHTNTVGGVTRFEYAQFDLLTARTEPDGSRYEFAYDNELRLTRVTNPHGQTWTYEYDAVGRLITETDFGGRVTRCSYNAAGELTSRTNALGQVVSFEHNDLGQVVRKSVDGEVSTYTYDFTDQIAHAANRHAELSLLRDRHGNLVSERINGREVAYQYDEFGQLTGRTTPSGAVSAWEYDPDGRPFRFTADGRVIALEYDRIGREVGRRFGESLSVSRSFDAMNRLVSQAVEHSRRRIQSRTYAYRADGSLTKVDDQLSGVRHYELDQAGRTTRVSGDGWAESYAYDQLGNQTAADWSARQFGDDGCGDRAYQGADLVRAGRIRYELDAAGRVVLRQKTRLSRKPDTWRYSWDAEDRLTEVVTPDGTTWRYQYDALGRRIGKQRVAANGVDVLEQVDFTWDGVSLCEQTTTWGDSRDSLTLTWHLNGGEAVAQSERRAMATASQEEIDTRFFAIVSDLSGSPCELIDESGEIAWRARSTNWGKLSWSVGSQAYTPLRFPGQYCDSETGLNYNYFRYYDPEVGQYVSLDPLGLAPAANPVGYVDRPSVSCDPLGLAPQKSPIPPKPYESPNFPDMAKQFNPEGGNTNCTFVADAFERYMRGEGIKPVPGDMGGLQSLDRLEHVYGASFKKTDFWNMVDHIRNSGDGARGIVAARPGEGMPGHVFNIVNQQGRVLFIDMQTGFVDPTLYNTFKLLRTN
ncbi:putative T7SS-secreted protein [Streptomyces sp. NPDC048751]|uniref:putative T7SS-secreted protein n=1 Tax=Streptomyces sp. NPDC048751 TaxID=3365591 RepID=UPI00371463F8